MTHLATLPVGALTLLVDASDAEVTVTIMRPDDFTFIWVAPRPSDAGYIDALTMALNLATSLGLATRDEVEAAAYATDAIDRARDKDRAPLL